MQIRTGTVAVEANSAVVTASAGNDWSQATVGSVFSVQGAGAALYDVAEVRPPADNVSGRWELSLTAPYAGATAQTAYQITRDFTPNLALPLIAHGDVETALLVNRALRRLDELISALPGGGGSFNFTDAEDVPAAYTGAAGRIVRVNATATGLEFVDLALPVADQVVTLVQSGVVALARARNYRVTADFGGVAGGHFGTDCLSTRGWCSEPLVTMVPEQNKASDRKASWLVYAKDDGDPYAPALDVVFFAKVRGPGFVKHGDPGDTQTTWTFEFIT